MSLKYDSGKKLRKEKAKWHLDSWEEYDKKEQEYYKELLASREPTINATVRITGGKAKNIQLEIPRATRPMTDRMKVSVFDILREEIANKTVLDLYAGAGSFGLEALSRGAKSCTFVDASRHSFTVLERNVNNTGFLSESDILKMKVEEFLPKEIEQGHEYEIIFMDPPYKLYNTKKVFKIEEIINQASKLLPGIKDKDTKLFKGLIIMKHPRLYPLDKLNLEYLEILDTYEFGRNSITFFIIRKEYL